MRTIEFYLGSIRSDSTDLKVYRSIPDPIESIDTYIIKDV